MTQVEFKWILRNPVIKSHFNPVNQKLTGFFIAKKLITEMKRKQIIRDKFRNEVFQRDGYKCKVCGRNDVKLDAHHIEDRNEMPNGGYVKENGITLCDCQDGCHMRAERYHVTNGKDWVDGFHPIELFKLIGSNLGLAKKESEKL